MKNNDIYLYDHNIYKNADFNVWMAFPGPESFALSSLGFLWMYKSIDECDDINVEMIFQDTKKTVIHKNALHIPSEYYYRMTSRYSQLRRSADLTKCVLSSDTFVSFDLKMKHIQD